MPADTINIAQDAESGQQYTIRRVVTKKGYLSSGFIHFPPGCFGFVDVRVSLEISGTEVPICPIPDLETSTQQFVSIDDFTLPFPIDRDIGKDDLIIVEIRNGDAVNDHDITVLAFWWHKKPSPQQIRELI